MSQVKASPPPQTQSPFSLSHSNQDLHSTHRIMTRRASRSAQSSSTPSTTKHDTIQENDITDSEPIGRMTTRSRSTDVNTQTSSSAEESSSTNNTTTTPSSNATTKRHVRTKRVTKPSPSSSSSSPTNTSMRRRRAAANKDTKPAGMMNAIKQQRLAELDELEQSILNGTHEEYQERMADAEKKRMDQRRIAEQRRHLEEADIRHTFDACKKAAYDQFHQSKAALRKQMITQVQAQIKRLEEEWHSRQGFPADDDQEIFDWVPPDRQTSIHILFFVQPNISSAYFQAPSSSSCLSTDEIMDDLKIATAVPYS
ncbi:hypothetical protein O0I10_001948 [Lichtheimia ornata]|uniref:Uncharacterized protein n=1 Tax=Lichtheimia ornata TaxID=688661 RepID=A0AAD7Y140_9FUNG|nr:uncharacterized protein O0I10_001948 [Lichtheimia ornata]KAJ8662255.1 hypothetical protein O0I10_001948 [Lichtheimia ornata]